LVVAAVGGAAFALLFSGISSGLRLALIGMFGGLVLFFLSEWVHGQFTPLVAVHIQRGSLMSAHVVYGLFLANVPHGNAISEPLPDIHPRAPSNGSPPGEPSPSEPEVPNP
jgi:uncharacterized YccA/Bax inhibitor family protein